MQNYCFRKKDNWPGPNRKNDNGDGDHDVGPEPKGPEPRDYWEGCAVMMVAMVHGDEHDDGDHEPLNVFFVLVLIEFHSVGLGGLSGSGECARCWRGAKGRGRGGGR